MSSLLSRGRAESKLNVTSSLDDEVETLRYNITRVARLAPNADTNQLFAQINSLLPRMKKEWSDAAAAHQEQILIAEIKLAFGDFEAAQNILSKLGANMAAVGMLGHIQLLRGNFKEAFELLQDIPPPNEGNMSFFALGMNTKGLCYEHFGDHEKAFECYHMVAKQTNTQQLKKFLENYNVQRSFLLIALLHEKRREYQQALKFFRHLFTQAYPINLTLRKDLLREYGRFLTRCMSQFDYKAPETRMKDDKCFVPNDCIEDAVLVLLLYEKELLEHDDFTVYDDLCLALTRRKQYRQLSQMFEQALARRKNVDKFFWNQFSLVLICCHQYQRALTVLNACISNEPDNALHYILSSKICLNNLNETKKSLSFATRAVAIDGEMKSQSYHQLGLTHFKMAQEAHSRKDKEHHQLHALEALLSALALDKNNINLNFHLALQYAEIREISKAFEYAKICLSINKNFVDGWLLLTLLFTSKRQYKNALKTCKAALVLAPHHLGLLFAQGKLEEVSQEIRLATHIYKTIFTELKKVKSIKAASEAIASEEDTEKEASTEVLHAEASKLPSRDSRAVEELLYLCECFTRLGIMDDAKECLLIARRLNTHMTEFYFQSGYFLEKKELFSEAVSEYEKCLALQPNHAKAMLRLGIVYRQNYGQLATSHNFLHAAVRADSTLHEAWYELGCTLSQPPDSAKTPANLPRKEPQIKDELQATECLMTSLQLDSTAPAIPFSIFLRAT